MTEMLNVATNVVLDGDKGKEKKEYVGPGEGINSIVAANLAIASAQEQKPFNTGLMGSPVSGANIGSVSSGLPRGSPMPINVDTLVPICGRVRLPPPLQSLPHATL